MDQIIEDLEQMLVNINSLKDGSRSDYQRCIAILATKTEDALAWAKHTQTV